MELPPRIYPWDDHKTRMLKHTIIRRQIDKALRRHRRRRLLEDIRMSLYVAGITSAVGLVLFQLSIVF